MVANEPKRMFVVCPFCGEQDFDLIGLKRHLMLWCHEYDDTPTTAPPRRKPAP